MKDVKPAVKDKRESIKIAIMTKRRLESHAKPFETRDQLLNRILDKVEGKK